MISALVWIAEVETVHTAQVVRWHTVPDVSVPQHLVLLSPNKKLTVLADEVFLTDTNDTTDEEIQSDSS